MRVRTGVAVRELVGGDLEQAANTRHELAHEPIVGPRIAEVAVHVERRLRLVPLAGSLVPATAMCGQSNRRSGIASAQHRGLVTEHQDFDVLGCVGSGEQR
jgi:hypothetical protein